jgi:beta-xylosidase
LHQGNTRVNGPHQGAWVQTPLGEDWFLHFQDAGPYGRITHLQPVRWRNDWPVIGAAADTDTAGEPVEGFALPRVRAADRASAAVPQASDDFRARVLGLQWQWQGNPRDDWFALPPGRARLRLAARPSPAANGSLWPAPNLLLQKFSAETFTATVRMTLGPHDAAATAGLIVFGTDYAYVGVQRTNQGSFLVQRNALDASSGAAEREGERRSSSASGVWLRVVVRRGAVCQFAVSEDGVRFEPFGAPFQAKAGRWVGAKLGLFARLDDDRVPRRAAAEFEAFLVTR